MSDLTTEPSLCFLMFNLVHWIKSFWYFKVTCFVLFQPSVVDCSTVQAHEGVYFTCPLCPASALQSEIDAHLAECLEKVQYMTV